jgi:ketosteroid isomerase-like protein
MNTNRELVERFYSAFQRLDHKAMNECYSDDIIFSDPVFGLLRGDEVRAMWTMLCKNAQDFALVFSDIELLDDEYTTCKWTATYTFSQTGKKVINNVKSFMKCADGRIIEHSDGFRLSTWIAQALGLKGLLFGWTGVMKKAVQKRARRSLDRFMQQAGTP